MQRRSKNKKVIILDNLKSQSIEQAILILREGSDTVFGEDYIIKEAQKIIDNYTRQGISHKKTPEATKARVPVLLFVIGGFMLSALSLLIFLLTKSF